MTGSGDQGKRRAGQHLCVTVHDKCGVSKQGSCDLIVSVRQDWKKAKDSGWKAPMYNSAEQEREVKKGFLFKVYGLLAMQLAVTVAFCALFMLVPACKTFIIGNR